MTESERLHRISRLENTVRSFRIASSGFYLSGGFGELKLGSTETERLDNLEKAVSEFNISSDVSNIFGSFDEGYVVE